MIRKISIFAVFFSVLLLFTSPVYAEEKAKSISASLTASSAATPLVYKGQDTRVDTLQRFLEQYDSPLAGDAQAFVDEADRNNIDWRLVTAISGVESTWAHAEPVNCYNSWGYNIYGDHVRCFASYKEAIGVISYDLRHLYMDQWGASDVYSIGSKYAASPTWAARVAMFMQNIQDFHDKTTSPTLPISL